METITGSWFMAALLLVVLSSAGAQNRPAYFAVGGSLVLRPAEGTAGKLTSILWKQNGNLVAEWVDVQVPLVFYGGFNGRTDLDTKTGYLTIRRMTVSDAGLYTVETNNQVQGVGYNAEVLKKVPKPEVSVRPLVCSPTSTTCTLLCEGDTTGTGPVTYSWKMGDGDWKESGKDMDMNINNDVEIQSVTTFRCKMNNSVSEEESEPVPNLFFKEEEATGGSGLIAGVIFGVLLVVVAGVVVWKRKDIMYLLPGHRSGNREDSIPASGEKSKEAATPLNPTTPTG